MTWTAPSTWTANQVVNQTDLNTQLRDNMLYLFSGKALGTKIGASTATTTSTTFVDIDATNYIITATINSGRAICWVVLPLANATVSIVETLDIIVDSATRASGGGTGGNGVLQLQPAGALPVTPISFFGVFTGLSVGSHTFKPQWRTSGGTLSTQSNGSMLVVEF